MKTVYDIAHVLESADGSEQRLMRALSLLRVLVPYEHCTLLYVQPERAPTLATVPTASPEDAVLLAERLGRLLDPFTSEVPRELVVDTSSRGRLAVPLVGLDEVIGVLEVRSGIIEYSVDDLRALSVVAAQLAAYLTMLRARAVDADRTRKLNDARRTAEAANRTKDELLALVSLELKTPLNATLNWAHSLGEDPDPTARSRAVAGIEKAVRAQSMLIDDILDLAGIASATVRLDLRAIDPVHMIRNSLEGLRLEAENRAIRLETSLDPSVTGLIADPDRFDQIISNLIAHALKFAPHGSCVEVHLERSDGHARIRVIDRGPPIAPEILPHVFESFRLRRDTDPRTRNGFGVGLAIVKNLVALHDGIVQAESGNEETGTTFTVDLPLEPGPRPLAGIHVLAVDDDDDFRDALRAILERRGATVTTVSSVPSALASLDRWKPDVLLCELAMPRESGYDLIRELVARGTALPAAALTKLTRSEEAERSIAAGFRMYLAKPIEVDALVAAVTRLAEEARVTRSRVGTR